MKIHIQQTSIVDLDLFRKSRNSGHMQSFEVTPRLKGEILPFIQILKENTLSDSAMVMTKMMSASRTSFVLYAISFAKVVSYRRIRYVTSFLVKVGQGRDDVKEPPTQEYKPEIQVRWSPKH